jgi:hypothetical protein
VGAQSARRGAWQQFATLIALLEAAGAELIVEETQASRRRRDDPAQLLRCTPALSVNPYGQAVFVQIAAYDPGHVLVVPVSEQVTARSSSTACPGEDPVAPQARPQLPALPARLDMCEPALGLGRYGCTFDRASVGGHVGGAD